METNDRAITYDQVPYVSMPFRASHPATLAALAALAGLATPPVANARVLEIGCAGGGNLLPMAAVHPNSQFVGIDLAARHIADARELTAAAQISNAEFYCQDLRTFTPRGKFDYIIAHGLYSWIPGDARDRLLGLAAENLTDNGVAFISYMVYPGAYVYEALRHAIQLTGHKAQPNEMAALGRQVTRILGEVAPKLAPRWGPVVAKWGKDMCSGPDFVILHDQLAEIYHPVYFTDFVRHAAANGLRYLSDYTIEEWSPVMVRLRELMQQVSDDPLAPIQALDIAGFRMFRQSVLARADAPIAAPDPLAVIGRGYVASDKNFPAQQPPAQDRNPQAEAVLQLPLAQAVLQVLTKRWPRTMAVAELARQPEITAGQDQALARCLLRMVESRRVELWIDEPTYIDDGADPSRARTTKLARVQAAAGKSVTNLRHHAFQGNDAEARRLVTLLDGARSAEDVAQHIPSLARNSMLVNESL